MIHGTISRTNTAFGALSPETVKALHERYEGRVFAFDHFTLSEDPRQNVDWFFRHVPSDAKLDVDIVCHSRGGLVARMLAEREGEFSLGSREMKVGRIVFVAVPNSGTILANGDYMSDFLDTYTNLLNFLPDNGVTESFETLIAVAKQLAVGALKGLNGLQSMRPGGGFLKALNDGARDDKRYFALSSNFEPTAPAEGLGRRPPARQDLQGRERSRGADPRGLRPERLRLLPHRGPRGLPQTGGIAHTRFFADPRVQGKILEWLS